MVATAEYERRSIASSSWIYRACDVGYYSLKYQWYILIEGIAVNLPLVCGFHTIFTGPILLRFEVSLRLSLEMHWFYSLLLGVVVIVPESRSTREQHSSRDDPNFPFILSYGNHIWRAKALQEELKKPRKSSEWIVRLGQQAQYKNGTMKEIFTLQERTNFVRFTICRTQSVHDYYPAKHFVSGEATKFTDSRNELKAFVILPSKRLQKGVRLFMTWSRTNG